MAHNGADAALTPPFVRNLLVFGRLLRRLGLEVHTGRLLDTIEGLQHVDLRRREEVYHTCRALLVHRHEELATFDRAFDAFWRARISPRRRSRDDEPASVREVPENMGSLAVTADEAGLEGSEPTPVPLQTWSDASSLAARDFGEFTADEIALAHTALDHLVWTPGDRRTRRWVAGHGPRIDVRRALARSPATGGEIITLPTRKRRSHPRPVVLLCDISGSMERYSRMLLHFAHALGRQHRRVEAFLYSTRLTRITTQLRHRRVDDAVSAVARAVPDWSGGTRTGEALRELHQQWSRRILHGGPVVLIVSDGWDRGDPAVLRDQIARLQRSCHRLIWLNPLIGTQDYAPLTRGLQAALPYVDDFLPARTLGNLAELAVHLNRLVSPLPNRR